MTGQSENQPVAFAAGYERDLYDPQTRLELSCSASDRTGWLAPVSSAHVVCALLSPAEPVTQADASRKLIGGLDDGAITGIAYEAGVLGADPERPKLRQRNGAR